MRYRVIVALSVLAFVLTNGLWIASPRGSYQDIVVHHSDGSGDFHTIRRAHLARGWFEIAYHFVLSNGSTQVAAGHLEPTWRYRLGLWSVSTRSWRHNRSAIHLCMVGNFEERQVPSGLQESLGHAVQTLQRRHGIPDDRILLHRDCGSTACPGRNVTRDRIVQWAARADGSPIETRRQHLRAIRGWRLTPGLYLLAGICCNSLLVQLWRWSWQRMRSADSRGSAQVA